MCKIVLARLPAWVSQRRNGRMPVMTIQRLVGILQTRISESISLLGPRNFTKRTSIQARERWSPTQGCRRNSIEISTLTYNCTSDDLQVALASLATLVLSSFAVHLLEPTDQYIERRGYIEGGGYDRCFHLVVTSVTAVKVFHPMSLEWRFLPFLSPAGHGSLQTLVVVS